jgi:hypothetical protein
VMRGTATVKVCRLRRPIQRISLNSIRTTGKPWQPMKREARWIA